jgi:hypothetical protein
MGSRRMARQVEGWPKMRVKRKGGSGKCAIRSCPTYPMESMQTVRSLHVDCGHTRVIRRPHTTCPPHTSAICHNRATSSEVNTPQPLLWSIILFRALVVTPCASRALQSPVVP